MTFQLKKFQLLILFILLGSLQISIAQRYSTTNGFGIYADKLTTLSDPQENYLEEVTLMFVQQVDSGNLKSVQFLLELGVDPNTSWYETTALMYASQRGHYEIARELLTYGAELDTKDPSGLTALHFAASSFNDSIAELLVLNGANPHPINIYGVSPLHYASAYGYTYMAYLLLYYGAQIDSTDMYGNTPLMASVYSGALETSEYLLESWADVDKPDYNGVTPLMVAAQFNDTTMMRLLTDYGADINKSNLNRSTALAIAISNQSDEAIKFLLEQNAALNNLPPKASYADLAVRKGYKELSYWLAKMGSPASSQLQTHYISPVITTTINSSDLFMSTGAEGSLLPFGINFSLDIGFRPYQKAIVVEDTYATYQFFERRYMASASIAKELAQLVTPNKSTISFSLGIRGYTSWASYNFESSVYQAKSYSFISPEIKATLTKKNFYLAASTYFLNMDFLRESPLTFRLTAGFIIDFTKPKIKQKKVEWY
jgi:ankyrin repeat protein